MLLNLLYHKFYKIRFAVSRYFTIISTLMIEQYEIDFEAQA